MAKLGIYSKAGELGRLAETSYEASALVAAGWAFVRSLPGPRVERSEVEALTAEIAALKAEVTGIRSRARAEAVASLPTAKSVAEAVAGPSA